MSMSDSGPVVSVVDLFDEFARIFREEMLPRGWEPDPRCDGQVRFTGVTLGMYRRPYSTSFSAHIDFMLEGTFIGTTRRGRIERPPWLSLQVEAGIRFPAADRLQRLLGAETDTFSAVLLRDFTSAAWADRVSSLVTVHRCAADLIGVVDQYALTALEPYGSVDGLSRLSASFTPQWQRFVVPAVLAAGGQVSEAQEYLAARRSRLHKPRGEPRGFREYERRMQAWFQAGACVPEEGDVPPEPRPAPLPPFDRESFGPYEEEK